MSLPSWAHGLQIPPSVQAVSPVAQRIAQLKSLHKRWTADLERLVATSPEVAFHLVESLQELEGLTRTLECEEAEPPDATPAD